MPDRYSIYEAKAKLSEIIRKVKRRRSVVITERGREVARVVPAAPAIDLARRLEGLAAAGIVAGEAGADPRRIAPVAKRRGALRRFLRTRSRF